MGRAMSGYVSWIMLVAMVIVISVFMYRWSIGYVEKQGLELSSRSDSLTCNDVSLSLTSICQDTQTLNMNVTNTNNLRIDKLQFRIIDIYGSPEAKKIDVALDSTDSDTISVLKYRTTESVKIIPIILKDKEEIACFQQGVSQEGITQC